jgi:type II secretory pathway pseudopilin PulG
MTTTITGTPRTLLRVVALAALLATGALTGCVPQPKTAKEIQQMEDQDRAARAAVEHEIQALYDEATTLVADTWPTPETEWGTCGEFADGTEAESWNIANQYKGPTKASPEDTAERVAKLWTDHGFPTKVVQDNHIYPPRKVVSYPPYLTGVREDGFGIEFTIGENYSDFVGNSRCAPIDPDDPVLPKNW